MWSLVWKVLVVLAIAYGCEGQAPQPQCSTVGTELCWCGWYNYCQSFTCCFSAPGDVDGQCCTLGTCNQYIFFPLRFPSISNPFLCKGAQTTCSSAAPLALISSASVAATITSIGCPSSTTQQPTTTRARCHRVIWCQPGRVWLPNIVRCPPLLLKDPVWIFLPNYQNDL